MPLVAHNELPAFKDLHEEGQIVLSQERAKKQDIRALHVGLLNMMPDAALVSTERQFFRLIGASNPIAQFRVHPFALAEQKRGESAQKHIDSYYETFDEIKVAGLDALIITGANVTHSSLSEEAFWEPLLEVSKWAHENVTSTLCSCLATHAILEARHGLARHNMGYKRWGVYPHKVVDKTHPLVSDINTRFDVPHSRYNNISKERFEEAGLKVLVSDDEGSVHLAVSADGIRTVYFQGHPEYDTISLLKEYKREVIRFQHGLRKDYPPFPANYFSITSCAVFDEYEERLRQSMSANMSAPVFPELIVSPYIDNTWHDSGLAVIGNWMGLVYQITNSDLKLPFMSGVDPDAPLLYLE
ncbi:homoserine O-succinyltransferase MetA [Leucothrix arctica]|uniref:Homoserine O-succinyltransferase n=1 Tax=Leucothrix arctica TaxID=1481894 RepID=A0A317CFY1_9GAMM|nr:homoserine O-succinyltransferase [Leucothrix arctica]PWQ97426.1 homoserine O-succinyltransferase [Leucothrix arctica]